MWSTCDVDFRRKTYAEKGTSILKLSANLPNEMTIIFFCYLLMDLFGCIQNWNVCMNGNVSFSATHSNNANDVCTARGGICRVTNFDTFSSHSLIV